MKISLNPQRYYLATPNQQWVVSDLIRDQLIDNVHAVALINYVQQQPHCTLEQVSKAPLFGSPGQWPQVLGALIKSSVLVQTDINSKAVTDDTILLNTTDFVDEVQHDEPDELSEARFLGKISHIIDIPATDIVLTDHVIPVFCHSNWQDLRCFVAVHDQQIMISPDFHKVCRNCFKQRILSHRPMLQFALSAQEVCKSENTVASLRTDQLKDNQLKAKHLDRLLAQSIKANTTYDSRRFYHYSFTGNHATGQWHSGNVYSYGNCLRCFPQGTPEPDLAAIQQSLNTCQNQQQLSADCLDTQQEQQSYRTRNANQVLAHLAPYINPHIGVISRLSPYRSINDDLIFNFSSGRNVAFNSDNAFWLKNHLRSASGGKGASPEQAQASALGEAIERYAMVHNGRKPSCYGSYSQLKATALHPAEILNFSDSQYQQRHQTPKETVAFHRLIPEPFNEESVIPWYQIRNLTEGSHALLAADNAFVRDPHCEGLACIALPDSNGCAAGSDYSEAILQGALELIERDAAAIWWYNRLKRPAVDLGSLNNRYVSALVQYYESLNRNLQVLDITTDIGIPCFVAVSYLQDSGTGILYGFGCHLEPQIAITRALTEINQLLPVTLTKRTQNADQGFYHWLDSQCVESHPWLYGKTSLTGEALDIKYAPVAPEQPKLARGIGILIEQLKRVGVSLYMHDISPPEVTFNVVKMIAPSLRHFWRRTAPGRLYDVPVKMGWLNAPLSEAQLNPQSIII